MKNHHKTNYSSREAPDWPIANLPGLSNEDQSQLAGCGISTTAQLIRQTKTPTIRQTCRSNTNGEGIASAPVAH
ncbi:MAG: hypothetical protein ACM65K_09385 [Microcoleus sp.]